ncbi:ABC transporter permease [Christiangramia forsetii]|uniref:FtsX family membrane protein (Predicted permease) n=2 Tax=Christiangramia forsetii TaxID=411153 RepID=A0LZ94_CHRFK|nr:ABC transporter permease [Christiangramia forsetii]GGG37787.1 ABC transporter permease [Christiangramia forsetii]CAL65689.1 FtsX family membrane protein (predicted permease) [Christiangramia forsetii KT0803]
MIKNYLKTGWRNILKDKGIFSINITGLAIGIASCLLIMLFVTDELSYDRFHEKAERIVRVVFKANVNGEEMKEAVVMAPVAQALKNDLPEVTKSTRLAKSHNNRIEYNGTYFGQSSLAYVDPNFFEIFSFPIIQGVKNRALDKPNTVVISKSFAENTFGNIDPIGKTLKVTNRDENLTITGVIEDMPKNSHFHFDLLVSTLGYAQAKKTSWMESDFFTYLVLQKDTRIETVEAKLPAISEKYMGPQIKDALGMTYTEFTQDNKIGLFLQPLTDIHLYSDFSDATILEQGGDIKYVYIFSAIAIFMLIIACINFMNLATASATKRAKEVGIRKVLGSNKKQLIYQFLAESFIATFLAAFLALLLVSLSLPFFNLLAGKELNFQYLLSPEIILAFFSLIFFIGFLAGGYPAFYLSSFNPLNALKSKFSGSGKNSGLRSGLVIFQFVISAGLILSTLVVKEQMDFIQDKALGYEKDQLLVVRNSYLLGNNEDNYIDQVKNNPLVENLTHSAFVPAGESDNEVGGIFKNNEFQRRMSFYNIDENYIPTMGMELLEGRNFSKDFGAESDKVILNQKAIEILGFDKDPIGNTFQRDTHDGLKTMTVIGVIKNFNFKSLHQEIEPLILKYNPYGGIIIRSKVADMSVLIENLNDNWNNYNVKEGFNYSILDDAYNHTYLKERKMGTILSLFALLTIIVACLGLFGLVTFTAEQRFKEIGIRKVLGSSATQIVTLLSKDFLKLVGLSFLIAFPLSYFLMNKWLQDFAYRTSIHWWLYLMAAVVTMGIAFLTIGIKSYKAASVNPIKSLKTE